MNVNIENTSTLGRKVTIEVEAEEIRHELDRAYNELRRSAQLKGFRPGHAPKKLLERFFGDQVRGDVIQRLVREYTERALAQSELKPLLAPEIVTEETDLAKALRFSAVFDVRPELKVKDYESLKVLAPRVEVAESEVEAALSRLRERQGTLKKVEGRTRVERGDLVLAEIKAQADAKPISGLKVEERILEVSPERLAHRLDELLVGAEVGKTATMTKSYEAGYAERELAGKTIEWQATVKEIFRRELPELDDEFAKDLGGYRDLDELKARIRRELAEEARQEGERRARQGLLDLILERNPVEAPRSLVARERGALEAELAATLEAAGMTREQAAEKAAQRREELTSRAERRARESLVVDALAEQEGVAVSDDELAEQVATAVTASGRGRERVAEFYAREENRETLRQSMRREKTLRLLLERAQSAGGEQAAENET